jgi:hypothetical protein
LEVLTGAQALGFAIQADRSSRRNRHATLPAKLRGRLTRETILDWPSCGANPVPVIVLLDRESRGQQTLKGLFVEPRLGSDRGHVAKTKV